LFPLSDARKDGNNNNTNSKKVKKDAKKSSSKQVVTEAPKKKVKIEFYSFPSPYRRMISFHSLRS
jgi:hypothetical protein